MTWQERAVIEGYLAGRRILDLLNWKPTVSPATHTALVAGPCPLYGVASDGRPGCTIHPVRPYNCRRFACLKPRTRDDHRFLARLQRKAQRWASKHGWTLDMED